MLKTGPMRRLLLTTALLAACACGHGPTRSVSPMPTDTAEDVRALLALEQSVVRAIQARDTQALSGLMSEDFVFRGPGDVESDRTAFFAGIANIPGTLLSVEAVSVRAHVFGNTGVLTGTQRARVRLPDGTEVTDVGHFTDVCLKREGRWWMVLAHSLPAAPEAPETPQPPSH